MLSILPVAVLSVAAAGQQIASFQSNEVHPNRTITFRYKDPYANKVAVELDGIADPLAMTKDSNGIWSVISPPLPPQIYGYTFEADGQQRLDPRNTTVAPNLSRLSNMVTVPGASPQLWESQNVPHGAVHHHFYTSKVVSGLVDGQSDYFVYTPPGYDAKKGRRYPVLYLLHGWTDLANGWTEVGQANFIFDNLIAEGKVTPMLVVMPLAYGDYEICNRRRS